jgi:peroxisomal 2,4-dienoyl-CoA reductase
VSIFKEDIVAERVALVTGGGTGIGKEIARTLGRHGARLAICSRKLEVLEAARKELEAEGLECLTAACDVRRPEEVERVIAAVLGRYGRLDIVVNNAAGNFPVPISGLSYNGFKAVVDIDLLGTYNVSKAAFEAWLKDHGGNIVNITAPYEAVGVALQAHVAAAKSGVDSLTRTCAVEWGSLGIRVNAVAPGGIADTEGTARFQGVSPGGESRIPLRRLGTKQEIADAVLFLVSDAASYVSGVVICVDGASSIDMFKMKLS